VRSIRWLTILAIVAAAATAVLLGAALAGAVDGRVRNLVALSLVSFLALVAAGAAWALASRRGPLVERAETASKLAHELKNPLMAIKGLASTGARLFDQMSDEEKLEFFRLIDEETSRLKRVIEQSATAMRVDAEQIAYDLQEVELGGFVEQLAWASEHAEHPMTVDTEPGVGVRADRKRLAEAIENLIDNAVKFSPPDAPIDVMVRADGGDAAIEVADRGPGIPEERVKGAFDRFGRWRPAGYEETPGAGLGLFIARAHVLAHKGRIEVLEREDGGTILRVTLPREG
jgi:two-component system, OmpR family, sensor histidine kinase ChvG